jgi:SAM-dependent methyltransferase
MSDSDQEHDDASPNFSSFAGYYDILYQDQEYNAECDVLESVFEEYATSSVADVLDCACGTGGHSLPLADRGYSIHGIDKSNTMLELAESKHEAMANTEGEVRFSQRNLTDFDLDKTFDAAICMTSSLGYLNRNEQILNGLRNIRSHLDTGSLFVFDVWNGLAVLDGPEQRIKTSSRDDIQIIRTTIPELKGMQHLCTLDYELYILDGGSLSEQWTEVHQMRYFFPKELELYLNQTGFEIVDFQPIRGEAEMAKESWHLLVTARAA